MNPHLHHLAQLLHAAQVLLRTHPRTSGGIALGIVAAIAATWIYLHLQRPTASEIERRRRSFLSSIGRTSDGVILDAHSLSGEDSTSPTPEVLLYTYRIAGVTYTCAQDVSSLPDRIAGYRLDQAIQVRYDPRNPGNSILASEDWTGLWQFRQQ